jgi:AcrR family transcriptional regulator
LSEHRAYDAEGRRARAAERREQVLATARRLFLERGYGPTSLPAIAREAGVSVEYLHKSFGGKAGLVQAIYDKSLAGTGDIPAPVRSDDAQAHEPDAHALFRRFGAFTAEVSALAMPVQRLMRDAAAGGDPAMIALWRDVQDRTYARMRQNAQRVADRGFLGEGVTVEQAADVFWAITSSDLYDRLVLQRGWTAERFAGFVSSLTAAALLD